MARGGSAAPVEQPVRLLRGDVSRTERQHAEEVMAMAVGSDRLFLGGLDGRVLSFDFESFPQGPLNFVNPEVDAQAPIVDMCVVDSEGPDRILLAVACQDLDLRLIAVPTRWPPPRGWIDTVLGAETDWDLHRLRGHQAPLVSVDAVGKFVLTAAEDKKTCVWDASIHRESFNYEHDGQLLEAFWLPGGSVQMVTAYLDGRVRIWDPRQGPEPVCEVQERNYFSCTAATPDGLLALGCDDGKVRFYDPLRIAGRCVGHLDLPCAVNSLTFALDDRFLFCTGDDGDIYAVEMPDFDTYSFEVQERDRKRPISRMCSHSLEGDSRTLLTYAFPEHGWSFAVVDGSPAATPDFA